jgi:uncharacterized phage-associated protein
MSEQDLSSPSWATAVLGFESRKAAQMSAYFAIKAEGLIEKLKLIKLIYLSERTYIGENHYPMLFDEFYSLPNGPICSCTLKGIDGVIHTEIWDEFIARNGNIVVAVKRFLRDDFDEISDDEIDTLDKIWQEFGWMSASQIRNYSHENCPEYTEIESGRIPISYRDVLEALGDDAASEVDRDIAAFRRAESVLTG